MQHVIVEKSFELDLGPTEKRIFPAGWSGAVDEEIAAAIVAAGSGRVDEERTAALAEREETEAASGEDEDLAGDVPEGVGEEDDAAEADDGSGEDAAAG